MNCELIKVCGMRDAKNIRDVAQLGIDMMGYVFWPKSPRYVRMISSKAGIIPDYSEERLRKLSKRVDSCDVAHGVQSPSRVGVFVDEMPQTIITHIYNFALDYVQLHGSENRLMIENLKRTLIPDIAPHIRIIKAIGVASAEDVSLYKEYEGVVDYFVFDTKSPMMGGSGERFDWSLLQDYDGETPFLIGGGIGPDDADRIRAFHHPRCVGIDINSQFETEPGVKDVERLRDFIAKVR